MKFNIEIDLEDFMDSWSGDSLNTQISDEIKDEVFKKLKKSPEYKAKVADNLKTLIENLK